MSQDVAAFRADLKGPLPLARPRFAGALTAAQRAELAAAGVALAFDPAQGGWVAADARGDDPDLPAWAALRPVTLRPWAEADGAVYHALLSDPGLWRYLPEPMPQPFEAAQADTLLQIAVAGDHHRTRAVIWRGVPVGQVRMLFAGYPADTAELSYWLAAAQRGRGLALAAVRAMLTETFAARPDLRRVVAFVHPENAASARLLHRAGFAPAARRAADGWDGFALLRETPPRA